MRIVVALIAFVLLGLLAGVGLSIAEYGGLPAAGTALARGTSIDVRVAQAIPVQERPRVMVQSLDYDFGTMELGTTRSHEFPVKNDGFVPLQLEQAGTSCTCTLSGLDTDLLQPGQTANVKLTWTAKSTVNGFRHTATIRTNDPTSPEIEFAIHGLVVESIEVLPQLIRFDKPDDEDWSTDVKVASTVLADLELTGYEVEDPTTAEMFAVELHPDTPTEPDIKSQWSVKVTVKPGLPLGRINQKILLQTNFADRPEVELSLAGTVESDLRVFGGRWNETAKVLNLGFLEAGKAFTGEIKVLARGENRDQVQLQLKQVVPDFLQVQIGDPQPLAGGARVQFPVSITVPADSRVSSYLGTEVSPYAEVVLETNHPDQPELRIQVGFSVSR